MAVFLRCFILIGWAAAVAVDAALVGGAWLSVGVGILGLVLMAFSSADRESDQGAGTAWLAFGVMAVLLLGVKDLWPAKPISGQEMRAAALGAEVSWPATARNPALAFAAAQMAALLAGLALVVALRRYAAGSAARVVAALTVLAVLLAVLGLAVGVVASTTSDYGLTGFVGVIRNKNGAATLVMLGALLHALLADAARRDNRPGWLLAHGLVALALVWPLVLLKSWTALVGLASGVAIYGAHWVRGGGVRWRSFVLLTGSGVVVAVLVAALSPALANRMAEMSRDYRFELWRDTLPMLRNHPWFGVGLGAFESVYPLSAQMDLPIEVRLVHPDSSWIKLWLEWGLLPALGLVVALVWGLLRLLAGVRRHSDHEPLKAAGAVAVAAACAWLASGLTDVTLHRPESFLVGMVCLGLACAALEPRPLRRARLGDYGALVAVLCVAVGLAFWTERVAARTGRWNLLSPELLWQNAEVARASGQPVSRQAELFRAAVRLQHRSVTYPLAAALLLHAQDREAALFFWQEAFRRAGGMAWDEFGGILKTLPPTPNEYWVRVAAESDPDLLLLLSGPDVGARAQHLVEWVRVRAGRHVNARTARLFLRAVDREKAWPLLVRAVDFVTIEDREFFVAAVDALRGTGDLAGAWRMAERLLPRAEDGLSTRPSALGQVVPEALVEVKAYEDLRRWLVRSGEGESERRLKILRRVCAESSVPAWFRYQLARELAARGDWAAAINEVLAARAAGR